MSENNGTVIKVGIWGVILLIASALAAATVDRSGMKKEINNNEVNIKANEIGIVYNKEQLKEIKATTKDTNNKVDALHDLILQR